MFKVSQILLSITPSSRLHGAGRAYGSVEVTAPGGQSWQAQSGAAWIQLVSGTGSGSGQVDYLLDANTAGERTGTLTIAGMDNAMKRCIISIT